MQSAQPGTGDRFRFMASDGHHQVSCMLATQLANLVSSSQLCDNTVLRVDDFICNNISGKK